VPPLRERSDDIPVLALHFLKKSRERHGKPILGFTEEAMQLLAAAEWKGNVRELENLIEKAVILAERDRIDAAFLEGLLPVSDRARKEEGGREAPLVAASPAPADPARLGPFLGLSLEDFDRRWLDAEKGFLEGLVREARGNLSEAARRACVRNRNTLISRLKRHGIERGGNKE
jgi:two-component system response regulator HydG